MDGWVWWAFVGAGTGWLLGGPEAAAGLGFGGACLWAALQGVRQKSDARRLAQLRAADPGGTWKVDDTYTARVEPVLRDS